MAAVTTVGSDTFIADTVKLIRDFLRTNLTDPISSTRQTNSKFVMTSYPQRPATYPIVTVRVINSDTTRLGLQSTHMRVNMSIEIRVWAKSEKQKDTISQQVVTKLRDNQFASSGPAVEQNLHQLTLQSSVNVDEEGEAGIKSRVHTYGYFAILT